MGLVSGVAGSLHERGILGKCAERQAGHLLLRQVVGTDGVIGVGPWVVGLLVVGGTI